MKRYNITTQKTYQQNGEEKKSYPRVGTLVKFEETEEKPEGFILEWNTQPDTKFYVFEDKPREDTQQKSFNNNEISPDDIPFN